MKNSDKKIKRDWKFYLGITSLLASFILPLFGFFVPFLKLPVKVTVPIVAFLTVGGPEITVIVGVLLLGKKVFKYYKNRVFLFLKRIFKNVSKPRYYVGLFIMFFSVVPLYINGYFKGILPKDDTTRYLILVSADFSFVISFFILGEGFWEKFKGLFIWNEGRE
jgi:hypothetical protein